MLAKGTTPSAFVKYLDQYVIGQEEAKKILAVAVYSHYRKISALRQSGGSGMIAKSNVLLIGSSGTGKTDFASQFIHYGIGQGEKGMIITPSESAEYMRREMMASFGWDFGEMEKDGRLSLIDVTDPVLRLQKSIDVDPVDFLINFRKMVERKLEEVKPTRLFIDDLTNVFQKPGVDGGEFVNAFD